MTTGSPLAFAFAQAVGPARPIRNGIDSDAADAASLGVRSNRRKTPFHSLARNR
jgi:hypothetical protein